MSADAFTVLTALALYAAATISPGPTFALITRLAVSGQRSAALGATLGLAIGATIYATLSLTGLALVITRIGWLATLVQVAGGGYLIYLGVTAWLTSHAAEPVACSGRPGRHDSLRGFRMGAIVELSNPKGIAFFLSLFAVSVPAGTALWAKLTILAGGFAIEVPVVQPCRHRAVEPARPTCLRALRALDRTAHRDAAGRLRHPADHRKTVIALARARRGSWSGRLD